jgi:outer membrane autotransporter protein
LGAGLGNGHSDFFQTGVYGRRDLGPAYVAGAFSYSQHDVTTNRNVTLAGFDSLQGNFAANLVSARAEGGYRLQYGAVNVTPYAALQTQELFLPATSEFATLGSSQFALASPSRNFNATRTELGAWFDTKALGVFPAQQGLTLYSRLAWAYDFDNEGVSTAFFQSLPGSAFVINSTKPARDGALTTIGFEYKLADGWSVLGKFDGEFSQTTAIFAGTGTIRKVW